MSVEYKVEHGNILKDGHIMFLQDVVKDLNRKSYLEEKLSLIQIEVDCKECIEGLSDPGRNVKCEICKGTGKITKPVESGDRGIIK